MKQIVRKYGFISGLILVIMVFTMMAMMGDSNDLEKGESVGYLFMIVAFSMIFFGIRQYRDKILTGSITFSIAFRVGILISLIASVCYVIGWMFYFHYIDNSFFEKYTSFYIEKINASGKPAAEIEKEVALFKTSMENYKDPFVMALDSFRKVFPMGLMITIICALLMRRKSYTDPVTSAKLKNGV